MSATVSLPPDVAAYLDQVRAALADLPPEERDELLADVETSLVEGAADSTEPIAHRLGPPDRFAGELRAAAGLDAAPATRAETREGLLVRLTGLLASPRARAARATALELAPVWWVVRGYIAAGTLALFAGGVWSTAYPLLPRIGSYQLGLLITVAAIAGSVWIGLRTRGTRPRWLTAANVVAVALAIPVLTQAMDRPGALPAASEVYFEQPVEAPQGLTVNGEPVRNVYPYSRDGKLLLDVLLYDDLGRPLEVGSRDPAEDPLRRRIVAKDGTPLLNAFPIRYLEPGTADVAQPLAGPEIDVPKVATPPLKLP